MEFIIFIVLVLLYQFVFIPVLKRKTGFIRPSEPKVFYDYKTKWQLPFELIIIFLCMAGVLLLTPALGLATSAFILIAFVVILLTRGMLEKRYEPDFRHYPVSFSHAIALTLASAGVLIYALVLN
ncbi:MAG: hypothetical protein ACI33P_13225 [Lysinibacillus sp.]